MGLKDKLEQIKPGANPLDGFCTVGKIIEQLPKEDGEALISALKSRASTRAIYRVLKDEGFKLERQTVTLHRKGFCRCAEAK